MRDTETLEDVLRELHELAPDRFRLDISHRVVVGPVVRWVTHDLDEPWVQIACQEECDEREFRWSIWGGGWRPRDYACDLFDKDTHGCIASVHADSPALAIAGALRDALRAEAGS